MKDEEKGEKKSFFTSLWNKAKTAVGSFALDSALEDAYNEDKDEFTYYSGDSLNVVLGGVKVYGKINDGKVVVMRSQELQSDAILVCDQTGQAYYVSDVEWVTVDIVYDNQRYTRKAQQLTIDDAVVEVDVIKAGDKFYLKR